MYDDTIDLIHPSMQPKLTSNRKSSDDPWPGAKNARGPARKPGWSVITSIVGWCIDDLYQGKEPQWRVVRVCTSEGAAGKVASRLRGEYADDLPKGQWEFKIGEVFPNGTAQVLARYSPRKFSEVAQIPGVLTGVRVDWLEKLRIYAQKKRESTQNGS